MSGKIISNTDATVIYSTASKAALTTSIPKASDSIPILKIPSLGQISPWGDDNLFPQNVVKDAATSTIIGKAIEKQASMAFGSGLVYGYTKIDPNTGDDIFIRVFDREIEDFIKASHLNRNYAFKAFQNFYWFYNFWPEFILNDNRQIVQISCNDSVYCRWGTQNPTTGLIENCYVNGNWDNGGKAEDSTIIPVLDIHIDPKTVLESSSNVYKFCYPVSFPTPGKSLYSLAHWNAVRTTGWLDVHKAIPEFKKALFENQLTIKYHIEVHVDYWTWKYGEEQWSKFSVDEKNNKKKEELEYFENILKGKKNAGKSIMTSTRTNPLTNQVETMWRITPIDDKIKSGIYIEDGQEASSHLLFALGYDPAILGNGPGKTMTTGGGTDKWTAIHIYFSTINPHKDIVLEPLDFVADYNGWNDRFWGLYNAPFTWKLKPGLDYDMPIQAGSKTAAPKNN